MAEVKGNSANVNDALEELIKILREVREYITDESDMSWSGFSSAGKLRAELDNFIGRLKEGNIKVLKKIEFEFLPTGSLQEHSISNGWGNEYINLSSRVDAIGKKLKND